jgi:hypothetical protein
MDLLLEKSCEIKEHCYHSTVRIKLFSHGNYMLPRMSVYIIAHIRLNSPLNRSSLIESKENQQHALCSIERVLGRFYTQYPAVLRTRTGG